MGCGESKQPSHGAAPLKTSGHNAGHGRYPLLDTPEEQAARFTLLCNPPPERKGKHGAASRQSPAPAHPNPLAVELERVYHDTRDRVFDQQKEDAEATAAKEEKARLERLQARHANQVRADAPSDAGAGGAAATQPPADAAAETDGDGTKTADAAAEADNTLAVLPPALQQPPQKDFTLYVNDSIEQARLRNFTAFDVVEAVELFVGYVKNDLRHQQEEAQRSNASQPGSRRGAQEPKTTPSVPWTCRMQCTLSGDSAQAEQLLDDARRRWREEREASHVQARGGVHHKSKPVVVASNPTGKATGAAAGPVTSEPVQEPDAAAAVAAEANEAGGRGLLLIDAVFESVLPGSFDRRTPWQLEIILYFAA